DARTVADPFGVIPGLGDDAGRLNQNTVEPKRRIELDQKFRLNPEKFRAVAVALLDAAFGVTAIAAHIPLARGAGRARDGIGRRTMLTTRPPLLKLELTGASSTVPSDSWPMTSRLRPGGAQPYRPATISRSVPQTPSAKLRTSTAPSDAGGAGTSSMPAEFAIPGATVRARIILSRKYAQPRCCRAQPHT